MCLTQPTLSNFPKQTLRLKQTILTQQLLNSLKLNTRLNNTNQANLGWGLTVGEGGLGRKGQILN